MALELEGPLRRELVNYLSGLDILQAQDGRRAVLRNAGLGHLIPRINLSGSLQLVLGNLVDFLAQWGTVEGQEALLLFLFELQYEVGEQGRKVLRDFAAQLSTKQEILPDITKIQEETSPEKVLEKLIGEPTLLPLSFLAQGLEISRSVVYIEVGRTFGTGFLIGPNLLMTNNHVLAARPVVDDALFQFNYQKSVAGDLGPVDTYRAESGGVFATNADLDYTVVELDGRPGDTWGVIPFKPRRRVRSNDRVNIIQHPNGQPKQISFRNNFVEYVDDKVIQYVTHTEPGSSGSPVFNDRWQLVALHHAGGNIPEPTTQRKYYRNEGITVRAILESLPADIKAQL